MFSESIKGFHQFITEELDNEVPVTCSRIKYKRQFKPEKSRREIG